ncbi:MAG TPA: glucose-1-phosphate thymidylyltransferase, partial [Flavobacteriales bacterium]|nr:glucose-1-phosphate thymidylyltransferase [Flavobacteriales bacterium]
MNYILFDDKTRENLLPLTFTKPTAELRFGILSIREKWEKHLNAKLSYLT